MILTPHQIADAVIEKHYGNDDMPAQQQLTRQIDSRNIGATEILALIEEGAATLCAQLRHHFLEAIEDVIDEAEESSHSDRFDDVIEARDSAVNLLAEIKTALIGKDELHD